MFLINEVTTYYNLFPSHRLLIVIDNTSLYYSNEIIRLYNKDNIIIKKFYYTYLILTLIKSFPSYKVLDKEIL